MKSIDHCEGKRMMSDSWIQTYTGKKFFPLDPRIEDIDVVDIAHALSLQCRFVGHLKCFYSVAQHSVNVSHHSFIADGLSGLLHDASEAYLSDIAKPLKVTESFSKYRELEDHLQKMIYRRFGLPEDMPMSVSLADRVLMNTEARDLFITIHPDFILGDTLLEKLTPWSPEKAESSFLALYDILKC